MYLRLCAQHTYPDACKVAMFSFLGGLVWVTSIVAILAIQSSLLAANSPTLQHPRSLLCLQTSVQEKPVGVLLLTRSVCCSP